MEHTEAFTVRDGMLVSYTGNAPEVQIPEGITCIGVGAFENKANLRSVTVPEGVTEICSKAFKGCYNLTAVSLPKSLTYIGSRAFEYCKRLQEIKLPYHLLEIGGHAFEDSGLQKAEFPGTLKKIGEYAFCGLNELTELSFSERLSVIGDHAFADCKKLRSIWFSGNCRTIGDRAFAGCTELSNVFLLPRVQEGPFCSPTAFENTPYQKKAGRTKISGESKPVLGLSGWVKETDGSLFLDSRGIEGWISANGGTVLIDHKTAFIVKFAKASRPSCYISFYYHVPCERIENGVFRRTAERHGGLIYLWDDAAAELAADPDKALKWIMDYIRSNESVPAEAFSPDIIEERDTSEAALRAFRASYRNAYIQILAAAKKYYIICAQWPTSDLYCEVKPKREQKGAHPVYDPTPIGNYRIYEISQLTKQQADIRLDMEDPEKVTRMMEEDRLRDLGLL